MAAPNATNGSTAVDDASRRLVVAERAYRTWAASRPGVVGAFVAGSAASRDASRGADVDLRVVVDAATVPPATFAFHDGVPLEWKFLPKSNYGDDASVLAHPFRAVEVAESVVLDDPFRFIGCLRERLRSAYTDEVYRRLRAGALLAAANAAFDRVLNEYAVRGAVPLWEYRCALFWSVEAALVRTTLRPTHRRGLVLLRDALRRLGAEGLHDAALNAFGSHDWTVSTAKSVWYSLRERIVAMPTEPATHLYLSPGRTVLWDAGFDELNGANCPREAALPLWTLLVLVWTASPAFQRETLAELWKVFRMERPDGLAERIEATRQWLASLETALDAEKTILTSASDIE